MAGEDNERRLAAIMSADVAGYSRLMGADEPGTLATLNCHNLEADGLQVRQRPPEEVTGG